MARGVLAAHLAGGMTGSLCGYLRAARRSRGSALWIRAQTASAVTTPGATASWRFAPAGGRSGHLGPSASPDMMQAGQRSGGLNPKR